MFDDIDVTCVVRLHYIKEDEEKPLTDLLPIAYFSWRS